MDNVSNIEKHITKSITDSLAEDNMDKEFTQEMIQKEIQKVLSQQMSLNSQDKWQENFHTIVIDIENGRFDKSKNVKNNYLYSWYELNQRLYRWNRLKGEKKDQWANLQKKIILRENSEKLRYYLNKGTLPDINSKDKFESRLRKWYDEQEQDGKCIDPSYWNKFKSEFEGLKQ